MKLSIKKAIKRPGAFSRAAKKRGLSTYEFAKRVLANPSQYSMLIVRQARFAMLLRKLRNKRKKK